LGSNSPTRIPTSTGGSEARSGVLNTIELGRGELIFLAMAESALDESWLSVLLNIIEFGLGECLAIPEFGLGDSWGSGLLKILEAGLDEARDSMFLAMTEFGLEGSRDSGFLNIKDDGREGF